MQKYKGGDYIYKIYIDTYFLFNFWMNLWVLFLCHFFLQSRIKQGKVMVAAFLASLGEVLILCIPYGNSLVKIIGGFGGVTALVIYLLFRPVSREYFFRILLCFYLSAFVLGGALLLLESIGGRRKISMISWGILVVFLVIAVELLYLKFKVKHDFCQVVLVFSEEEKCQVTALVDSGNGLLEPISRMPVSIIEERVAEPYKSYLKKEKFRLIPFHSLGEERGMLEAYFIEKMEIRGKEGVRVIKNPVVAISKGVISANEKYQMILQPEILKYGGIEYDI